MLSIIIVLYSESHSGKLDLSFKEKKSSGMRSRWLFNRSNLASLNPMRIVIMEKCLHTKCKVR